MTNADAIKALGAAMGLPMLALDAENTCNLMIDGKQEVYLSGDPMGTRLRLCAVLGDLAALRADPGLMLEINYDATESGGGALAINRMTSEVVYVKSLDIAGQDGAGVTAALESFIGYAAFWLENIDTLSKPVQAPLLSKAGDGQETIIRI
jgi:hypothetical protein